MRSKKTFFIFLGIALVCIVAVLILNALAERKIDTFLDANFSSNELVYGNIDVDILFGNVEIDSVTYKTPGFKMHTGILKVQGVHYWDFLVNNKIVVDQVCLNSPTIKHFKIQKDTTKNIQNNKKKFDKNILLSSFKLENGTYMSMGAEKKDTLLFVGNISGEMNAVHLNEETLLKKIPFDYGSYSFLADRVYFNLNKYYEFSTEYFLVSNEKITFKQFFLHPKYSRKQFSRIVPYEKDMYRLNIGFVEMKNPSFNFMVDHPVFKSSLVTLNGLDFKIYRDKTVTDNLQVKKMYSEMLRDLNLKLDIKKIIIENGFLKYQELIKKDRPPGRIAFYDLNAVVTNLTNMHLERDDFPKTQVEIHTSFMNTSDLEVNWQFDVSNKREHFTISGEAKRIPPEAMNPFFVPALHVKAKGNIDALYFNFQGDQIDAIGDMKMNYHNFSVTVLKENGEEKNKLLTAIVNLFVKASPKNGAVVKKDIKVKRDPTKSFWNYFWSCIEKGLLKSVL